jgi:hypothetical protein
MVIRDTTTGGNYENEIQRLLETRSFHKVQPQVNVGKKRNGGKHIVDVLLNGEELISLKYQEVQGTAEEKIPFEVMKLQHMVIDGKYKSATIVLAGPDKAWNWKDYYLGSEFQENMKKIYPDVSIISHAQFVQVYLNNPEGIIQDNKGLTQWIAS